MNITFFIRVLAVIVVLLPCALSSPEVAGQAKVPPPKAPSAQQDTGWTTYSSAEGKCEIMFPGKATTKGDEKATQAVLEVLGGKAVYLLAFTALTKEIAIDNKEDVKKVFDDGRDAMLKSLKGSKILKEMDSTVEGCPARDIDMEAGALGLYRARFVLTPRTFHQVVTVGPMEFVEGADAMKFRESFKLKKGDDPLWTVYSSPQGKCEIKFPGKATDKGDEKSTQVTLEALNGKAVYILAIRALAKELAIDNKALVKKSFDDGRDSMLKSLKGSKILSEKDTTFEGYPARDIDIDAPGLGLYRARFVLTPRTFYQIVTFGPREFVEAADAKKFRDSFKLKAK